MEPSQKTLEEIGRLCMAWAYLETVSEHTLWGILQADRTWGEIISARQTMEGFWKLILEHAQKKLDELSIQELKGINKDLIVVTSDRNTIVHGRVVARIYIPPNKKVNAYEEYAPIGGNIPFQRQPCWVTFKGSEAGNNFPISTLAVKIVCKNVQSLAERLQNFNKRFGHFNGRQPSEKIIENWPKRLE